MAPKPRGLKASSKAKAFVPPPTEDASSSSTTTTAETSVERTYPTDGDALSISDLYELRASAQALLSEGTPEKEDEARGLLRGILHGADALVNLATRNSDSDKDWFLFDADRKEGVKPAEGSDENDILKFALGLTMWHAPALIAYLQAWALHELGNHLAPPVNAAAAIAEGGSKRRKVDLREPTAAEEWMDEGLVRYEVATKWWASAEKSEVESGTSAEHQHSKVLVWADHARADFERAAFMLLKEAEEETEDTSVTIEGGAANLGRSLDGLRVWREAAVKEDDKATFEYVEERGELAPVVLSALTSFLALVDSFPDAASADVKTLMFTRATSILSTASFSFFDPDSPTTDYSESPTTESKKREVEVAIARADVGLAAFVVVEEGIEQKYRPEAEEKEEEDEEEDEVVPLPDEEDVREAKKRGEAAIKLIRDSIELLSGDAEAVVASRKAQYQKLEEAYLVFSALINPDDEEASQAIDAEVAKIQAEV